MNAAEAKSILAPLNAAVTAAHAVRDGDLDIKAWLAAGVAIREAAAARDAEIKRLAMLEWPSAVEMEMCLYGRLLRRHTDPVRVTWSDLHG